MEESPATRAPADSSGDTSQNGMARRTFVRRAGVGALGLGAATALPGFIRSATASTASPTRGSTATSPAGGDDIVDSGAGMYTGMSTAQMMSSATINRSEVSCGVGTLGLDATTIESLIPVIGGLASKLPVTGGSTGPFAMLMYAITVSSYDIDRPNGVITAKGRMRSITRLADQVLEDTKHPYLAVAKDGRDVAKPYFAIHFKTPFWSPSNPLATPSDTVNGWVMFGGNFLVGTVNVRP